jgi:hypothetical protein
MIRLGVASVKPDRMMCSRVKTNCWFGVWASAFLVWALAERDAVIAAEGPTVTLTLAECRQRMTAGNEAAQIKLLDWLVARQRQRGEKGALEPEFIGSAERDENRRANTIEQARALNLFGANTVFNQKNNLY